MTSEGTPISIMAAVATIRRLRAERDELREVGRRFEARIIELVAMIDEARASLDATRNKALDEAAAKIHWLWNADGTKGERRVAAETIAAILALKTQEPTP